METVLSPVGSDSCQTNQGGRVTITPEPHFAQTSLGVWPPAVGGLTAIPRREEGQTLDTTSRNGNLHFQWLMWRGDKFSSGQQK